MVAEAIGVTFFFGVSFWGLGEVTPTLGVLWPVLATRFVQLILCFLTLRLTTTALASLYSAVTVLLAWAIMRERLSSSQWAGVGVVMTGVLLVSV